MDTASLEDHLHIIELIATADELWLETRELSSDFAECPLRMQALNINGCSKKNGHFFTLNYLTYFSSHVF